MAMFGRINQGYTHMISIEAVIKILWKPFIKQINSGSPVYFTYHRFYLFDLFKEEGILLDNPVYTINEIANKYIEIEGDHAVILPEVFEPAIDDFSPSIILVCQQILAVEEMVRDQSGYSDSAYFPRLRKNISLSLNESSLNPFSFTQFEKLWKTLASEMKSIRGFNKSTITFRFGADHGINKSRSFPLSQALLSRDDLKLICNKIGLDVIKKHDNNLWGNIQSIRNTLKNRAFKLLSLSFLKDRVLDQVVNFAKNANLLDLKIIEKISEISDHMELRFYKEFDLFNENIRAYIYNYTKNENISDESMVINYLFEILDSNFNYLFLPLSDTNDFWVKRKDEIEIKQGDTFLALGNQQGIATIGMILETCLKGFRKIDYEKDILKFYNDISLIEIINHFPSSIFIKDGKMIKNSDENNEVQYEWIGGISISAKSDLYFKDYLPHSIVYRGNKFLIQDVLRINSKVLSFENFIKEINYLSENTLYTFEFPLGYKANIWVAKNINPNNDLHGFEIKNSLISPVLANIENNVVALCGFHIINNDNLSVFPNHILIPLIQSLIKKIPGRKLNPNEYEKIKSVVIKSCPTPELKRVLQRLFINDVYLPDEIIKKLNPYL